MQIKQSVLLSVLGIFIGYQTSAMIKPEVSLDIEVSNQSEKLIAIMYNMGQPYGFFEDHILPMNDFKLLTHDLKHYNEMRVSIYNGLCRYCLSC